MSLRFSDITARRRPRRRIRQTLIGVAVYVFGWAALIYIVLGVGAIVDAWRE